MIIYKSGNGRNVRKVNEKCAAIVRIKKCVWTRGVLTYQMVHETFLYHRRIWCGTEH